jgi:adenylate cyclase class 2
MIEVEVKIKLKNKEEFLSKIIKMGARKISTQIEEDTYFKHPLRNYSKTDEALRIRKSDNEFSLTYKGPKLNIKTKTREELSIKTEDGISLENIMRKIGFTKLIKLIKRREIYELNDVKIYVDHIENLGDFIEVEKIIYNFREVNKIENELFEILEKLGFSREESITKSYLELIMEKNNSSN